MATDSQGKYVNPDDYYTESNHFYAIADNLKNTEKEVHNIHDNDVPEAFGANTGDENCIDMARACQALVKQVIGTIQQAHDTASNSGARSRAIGDVYSETDNTATEALQ